MIQPSVYIILLNYNGYKDTICCIDSLRDINYKNYKIIVVDNHSTDSSKKEISQYIKNKEDVIFIESKENLGFSGGNNLGIKYAMDKNADYICLLNNDTTVESDFLNYLVDAMENDKGIGISAGKIMYYDNKDIVWSAGGYIDSKKAIGYNYAINKHEKNLKDESREVTFLTGCLQLIRREVFENVGLYDHEYFLYMEDVDFCKRAINSGYKLVYVPESKIYHKVSASTGGQVSPMVVYYMTRNRLLFSSKYTDKLIDKLKFYMFYSIKLISEPLRKKINPKYITCAVKDFINKDFGCKDISKI